MGVTHYIPTSYQDKTGTTYFFPHHPDYVDELEFYADSVVGSNVLSNVTPVDPTKTVSKNWFGARVLGTNAGVKDDIKFDPIADTFTENEKMNVPRYQHVALKLSDNRIFVCGGAQYAGQAVSSAEIYNPTNNTWTLVAPMPLALRAHAGIVLGDGKVLICGGYDSSDLETSITLIYDPAINSWFSKPAMRSRRAGHHLYTLPNGNIIAVAGTNTPYGDPSTYVNAAQSAEIYTIGSESWILTPSLLNERSGSAMIQLSDGRILVAGGVGQRTVEVYNHTLNRWEAKTSMPSVRRDFTLSLLSDGRVLAAGGRSGSGGLFTSTIYNVLTDAWSAGPDMYARRYGHTADAAGNDTCVVIGGFEAPNAYNDVVEYYDEDTNSWLRKSAGTLLRTDHVTVVRGSDIYILGGRAAYTPTVVSGVDTSNPNNIKVYLDRDRNYTGTQIKFKWIADVSDPFMRWYSSNVTTLCGVSSSDRNTLMFPANTVFPMEYGFYLGQANSYLVYPEMRDHTGTIIWDKMPRFSTINLIIDLNGSTITHRDDSFQQVVQTRFTGDTTQGSNVITNVRPIPRTEWLGDPDADPPEPALKIFSEKVGNYYPLPGGSSFPNAIDPIARTITINENVTQISTQNVNFYINDTVIERRRNYGLQLLRFMSGDTAPANKPASLNGPRTKNVTVKNGIIAGNNKLGEDSTYGPRESWWAVSMGGPLDCSLEDLKILNSYSDFLYLSANPTSTGLLDSTENLLVKNVEMDVAGRQGVVVNSCIDVVLDNCTIKNVPHWVFDSEPVNANRMLGFTVQNCTMTAGGEKYGFVSAQQAFNQTPVPVTLSDCVINSGSPVVTSATGAFTANVVGNAVYEVSGGTAFATGAYVVSYNKTSITLSSNATRSGTGVSLIIDPRRIWNATVTSGSNILSFGSQTLMKRLLIGAAISGTGIPAGTYIKNMVNTTTAVLSKNATATNTANISLGQISSWRDLSFLNNTLIRGNWNIWINHGSVDRGGSKVFRTGFKFINNRNIGRGTFGGAALLKVLNWNDVEIRDNFQIFQPGPPNKYGVGYPNFAPKRTLTDATFVQGSNRLICPSANFTGKDIDARIAAQTIIPSGTDIVSLVPNANNPAINDAILSNVANTSALNTTIEVFPADFLGWINAGPSGSNWIVENNQWINAVDNQITADTDPGIALTKNIEGAIDFGTPITFTATVNDGGSGQGVPTGAVTFDYDGNVFGSAVLSDGVATITTTALPAGTLIVRARYSGNATYRSVSANLTQIVNPPVVKYNPALDIALPSVSNYPDPFDININVNGVVGPATGTVSVFLDSNLYQVVTLVGGSATVTITGASVGERRLLFNYSGDLSYNASSTNRTHSVESPPTGYYGTGGQRKYGDLFGAYPATYADLGKDL